MRKPSTAVTRAKRAVAGGSRASKGDRKSTNAGLTTVNEGLTTVNAGLTTVNESLTAVNEGMLVDINVLKQSEQRITETLDFAEAVIESVPPLLILEPDLRVRTANQAFCRTFGVTAEQTQKQLIYELGNGQWNIPALRKLFEEILPFNSSFQKYEVTHDFEGLGQRIMLMSGRKVESMHAIVLSIEDITARKQAEEASYLSNEHFRQLANGIPNLSWTANAEGWIFWYNDRWYQYTGTTPRRWKVGAGKRFMTHSSWPA